MTNSGCKKVMIYITNNRYLDDKYKWTKAQRSSVNSREREYTLRSTKQKHIVYNWGLSKIGDYRTRGEEDFRKNVQRQPFPQPCAETRRGSSRFLFFFWITGMWKRYWKCDDKLISYLWQIISGLKMIAYKLMMIFREKVTDASQDPNNVKAEPFLKTIFHIDGWVESTR